MYLKVCSFVHEILEVLPALQHLLNVLCHHPTDLIHLGLEHGHIVIAATGRLLLRRKKMTRQHSGEIIIIIIIIVRSYKAQSSIGPMAELFYLLDLF